jgi:hypothetical protein
MVAEITKMASFVCLSEVESLQFTILVRIEIYKEAILYFGHHFEILSFATIFRAHF